MHVIVLAGGSSPERPVSLRSGTAVARALRAAGHHVTVLDPADGIVPHEPALRAADVVFPALHGIGGEDGTIQAQLETWHVPYVGSDAAGSAQCFDKASYRRFLSGHGLRLPDGRLVDQAGFAAAPLRRRPYVLKPADGGSSLDVIIDRQPDGTKDSQIASAFDRHGRLLLEELIDGVEITVGILDDTPLPVIEIIPPAGGAFDYANKYNGTAQELCPPRHVTSERQTAAQNLALQVHRLCGCRDFSRSDAIIDPTGTIYLLETNTIPGLTEQSLFPRMAAADGLAMTELCDRLVRRAAAR